MTIRVGCLKANDVEPVKHVPLSYCALFAAKNLSSVSRFGFEFETRQWKHHYDDSKRRGEIALTLLPGGRAISTLRLESS